MSAGWQALAAGLVGAAVAFAVMAFDAWAARKTRTGRRVGSLTSVDEGRQG